MRAHHPLAATTHGRGSFWETAISRLLIPLATSMAYSVSKMRGEAEIGRQTALKRLGPDLDILSKQKGERHLQRPGNGSSLVVHDIAALPLDSGNR